MFHPHLGLVEAPPTILYNLPTEHTAFDILETALIQHMKILALEPYYGGSHRAFLDGWRKISRHDWTTLTLPAHKWKWRMRHSAITFAQMLRKHVAEGKAWDAIFCSDMLNLAEFKGLAPTPVRSLPAVIYFHENQLTYPVRFESERDFQFALTNMTGALAADAVWFNSAFHRDSFLDALTALLRKMPDNQPLEAVEQIRSKTSIHPPGALDITPKAALSTGPLRILWAARWEHDKNPEDFFEALKLLERKNVPFKLSVIGEQFRDVPECFERAHGRFAGCIETWGYQSNREQYEQALTWADVFVSTAVHEFFGISAVEAALAGAFPLLPDRLAYPEILKLDRKDWAAEHFYDGTPAALANKLAELASRKQHGNLWDSNPNRVRKCAERFLWDKLAPPMDTAIEDILNQRS